MASEPTIPPMVSKVCRGCPFKKASIPGWLGDYSGPDEFLDIHERGEVVNPCHQTQDYGPGWKPHEKGRSCRGQAIMFANHAKHPRAPELMQHVREVEPDDAIFRHPSEFKAHHGGDND